MLRVWYLGSGFHISHFDLRVSPSFNAGKGGVDINIHLWVVNIVACRPVTKRWLCNQRPLLGNASNMHTVFRAANVATQQGGRNTSNNRRDVISIWSVLGFWEQGKAVDSERPLCTGVGEGNTWAREVEEFPLLEAIDRELLVKA
jgi:hypothetical protein